MTLYAIAAARGDESPPPDEGFAEPVALSALRRPILGAGRVTRGMLAAAALAAIVSTPLRGTAPDAGAQAAAEAPSPRPSWIEIRKPLQLYSLSSPEFGKAPQTYEARRLPSGDARADILSFGEFGGAAPWLRLTLLRAVAPSEPQPGFFVDMARRGAEAGLALTRSGQPLRWQTRFGGFDIAEIQLDRSGAPAGCLGFRLADSAAGLQIGGLACSGEGKPLAAAALACALERLNLNSSGEDVGLRSLFTKAELKRDHFCSGSKYVAQEPRPAT